MPGSLTVYDINNNIIHDSAYIVNYATSFFYPGNSIKTKQVKIMYRTFPFAFAKPYFHRNYDDYVFSNEPQNIRYVPFVRKTTYYKQDDKVIKSGNISRGITIGNNQNASLTSNLNLQLSGRLSDKLFINACISDDNIPIQPDGYTQQIQEFDKVYIQLYSEKTDFTFGDFSLSSPQGYLMRYNRKLLGGTVKNIHYFQTDTLIHQVSLAVSRGKYNRFVLQAIEGNQGPYRLRGANNENYIIILAGSEKVYVDGKLMKRGEEFDYVIDHNSGEITFMPRQLITKDKRIIVEYEYSEQNYARFIMQNANELRTKNSRMWVNVFSEADNKNQNLQQDLSAEQRALLASVGDSVHKAFVPNVEEIAFDPGQVLYIKKDTLVDNILYKDILVYSTEPDSARYRAGFIFTGDNRGNYVLIKSSANGKVYQWVAPVNGIPQGNYEPYKLLVAPKAYQMLTLGTESRIAPTTKVFAEIGLSNNDINSFSSLDNTDNTAMAGRTRVSQQVHIPNTLSSLHAVAGYQYVNKNFTAIERYRDVEFERDWNITTNNSSGNDEHSADVELGFLHPGVGNSAYTLTYLKRGMIYEALQHKLYADLSARGFVLNGQGSILQTDDMTAHTQFVRHHTTVSKTVKKIIMGLSGEMEENIWFSHNADSLMSNSFFYNTMGAFIKNSDSLKNSYQLSYANRQDFLPKKNALHYHSVSEDVSGLMHLNQKDNHSLRLIANYRKLNFIDEQTVLQENNNENTVLGRIENNWKIKKGFISSATTYEIGSGMEIKKDFFYLEVSPGQGVYTWSDYNTNGIKEINEFEVAVFKDRANYIRIFTPTNEYIKAYSNMFSQNIALLPSRISKKKTVSGKFISRFEDKFAFAMSNKNTITDALRQLNPFRKDITDTSLLNTNYSFRNTLSFNKFSQYWSMEYFMQRNENKILLLNGFNTTIQDLQGARLRVRLWPALTLYTNADIGNKIVVSDFFADKNYNIHAGTNQLSLKYIPQNAILITGEYAYSEKYNVSGNENVTTNNMGIEFRYSLPKSGSVMCKGNYICILYPHPTASSVAYEMLEGLMPGKNYTWKLLWQKKLSNGLEIYFSYDGRKMEKEKTIHTGSMQIRIHF